MGNISNKLVEQYTHDRDVSGNTISFRRGPGWDYLAQFYEAGVMGKYAMAQVIELSGLDYTHDTDRDYALKYVSQVAIQHPPLFGRELLEFMESANERATQGVTV